MANIFVPITCLALLGGSLIYGEAEIQKKQEIAPSPVADAHSAKIWLLSNEQTHDVCIITKTQRITANTSRLEIGSTCDGVITASNYIAVWQQDAKGNVVLGDEQGNTIVEFNFDEDNGLTSVSDTEEKLSLSPNT